jgi:hypothetical protein
MISPSQAPETNMQITWAGGQLFLVIQDQAQIQWWVWDNAYAFNFVNSYSTNNANTRNINLLQAVTYPNLPPPFHDAMYIAK